MLVSVVAGDNLSQDLIPKEMAGRMVVGTPDHVAEQIKTNVIDAGIDGVIINMPGYVPGAITKVGEALRPVVGA